MKRNILVVLIIAMFLPFVSGCEREVVTVNMGTDGNETVSKEAGTDALIFIGGGLYYDPMTKIVYFWNGISGDQYSATMPSPYYAPNGLPYKYDVESNSFEEIREEWNYDRKRISEISSKNN